MALTYRKNSSVRESSDPYFDRRASAYHCNSLRWPWSWLRAAEVTAIDSILGDLTDIDLLDLGCGAGYYARRYVDKGIRSLVAVDISQEMINQISDSRIKCEVGDAATIEIDGKFDIIISAGLLEFVSNVETVLANARRHMREGGQLIILVPRHSVAGRLYQRFHKRNGMDINLFDIPLLRDLAGNTDWTMIGFKLVFPFSLVAKFETAKVSHRIDCCL